PTDKIETMRTSECAKIDGWERLLRNEIDYSQCVVSASAVVGDVGCLAIGGGDDFVWIVADRSFRDYLQRRGINDGNGMVMLTEGEESLFGSLGGDSRAKNSQEKSNRLSLADHRYP